MKFLLLIFIMFLCGCASTYKETFSGFRFKDGNIISNIVSQAEIERYESDNSIRGELTVWVTNNSSNPFSFNYFADKFIMLDSNKRQFALEKMGLNSSTLEIQYPNGSLNPGETRMISLRIPSSAKRTTRGEIVLVGLEFPIDEITILMTIDKKTEPLEN